MTVDLTEEVVAEDWQVVVGDWTFGTGTDYPLDGGIDGIDTMPGLRVTLDDRGGMGGAFVAPMYVGPRYLTTGFLLLANGTSVPVMADVARAATNPTQTPYPIQFCIPGRPAQYVMGRFVQRSIPNDIDYSLGYGRGVLQAVCEDPVIYTVGSTRASLTYPISSDGDVLPASLPITLAPSGAATAAATNGGTWAAPLVATITGVCTGITFGNLTTDQQVEWTGSLVDGDELRFDTHQRTVTLNGAPADSYLTAESLWPLLAAGSNTLVLIATTGTVTAAVSWHDANL